MQTSSPDTALEQLAQAFAHWRANKPNRISPIPDSLLEQARELAQVLPISRVVKRLGLSHAQLQPRPSAESSPKKAPSATEFFALGSLTHATPPAEAIQPPSQTTPLTLQLNHGNTLTLTGLPTSQLVALLTALLER